MVSFIPSIQTNHKLLFLNQRRIIAPEYDVRIFNSRLTLIKDLMYIMVGADSLNINFKTLHILVIIIAAIL